MRAQSVLRVVASKLLIPFILLFGFYVQFHGDYGPGGGFQAGVIVAAAFILFSLIYGPAALRRVANPRFVEGLVAIGVLVYAGTGVATMLLGGNFLDYNVFDPHHPSHGQHTGLLVVELGVGITVAAVMISIFLSFAGRGTEEGKHASDGPPKELSPEEGGHVDEARTARTGSNGRSGAESQRGASSSGTADGGRS